MRQVPEKFPKYGIVGNGQMATHTIHYFSLLGVDAVQWCRHTPQKLENVFNDCTHILLLISDDAIEDFYLENHEFLKNKIVVHFSGARYFSNMIGLHPLMTFSNELYKADEYRKIHFVVDRDISLEEHFPMLKNSYSYIPADKKALYHGLCVMAGNFPQMIWQKCEKDFLDLGIPNYAFKEYLKRVVDNYLNIDGALTGPFVRNDFKTIENNLNALEGDNYHGLYQSMKEAYFGEVQSE